MKKADKLVKNKSHIVLILFAVAFACLSGFAAWQVDTSPIRPSKLFSFFVLLAILAATGTVVLFFKASIREKIIAFFQSWKKLLASVAVLLVSASWLTLSLTANTQTILHVAVRPVFIWSANLGILAILYLAATGLVEKNNTGIDKKVTLLSLGFFALLGLVSIFMTISGLGLEQVGYYWYQPGTPILIGQTLVALLAAGGLSLFLNTKTSRNIPSIRVDWVISLVIFILTAFIWLGQPMSRPVTFMPVALPPNYEIYPDSDSTNLDINAQSLLIGQPLSVIPADKPTYSFFLYLLHLFSKQDYTTLTNLQAVVLSLIAPAFYLFFALGFSNRSAGLAAALLFSLREANSIRLSNIIMVSHSKLILSDVPSAGLMILLSLLLISWMREPDRRRHWPLWVGIVFAVLVLMRAQAIILAPLIILGALYVLRHKPRRSLAQAGVLLVLGFAAFSLPWSLYSLNAPPSPNAVAYDRQLAIQFQFDPLSHNVRPLEGESESDFSARLRAQAFQFVRENPGYTIKAISAYFFRNLAQSFLILPASFQLEEDPITYKARLPYWENWVGGIPPESRSILVLNLLLLAIGLAAAWRSIGPVGLMPLILYLGYVASLALPMISGWRFLLPADWIVLAYYLLGATTLAGWLWRGISGQQIDSQIKPAPAVSSHFPWPAIIISLTLTILFSSSLFVIGAIVPERYPMLTQTQQLQAYTSIWNANPELPNPQAVETFLTEKNAVLLYGRTLYPRHFDANEGFSRNGVISFRPREYPRLGFYLLGPEKQNIVLPLEQSPAQFPHAADAWVLGCRRDTEHALRTYTEAVLVILPEDNSWLWQSGREMLTCKEQP